MKRKIVVYILFVCFFLFPLTVNSQTTTTGKIEFYRGESEERVEFEPRPVENKQTFDKETIPHSGKSFGQFGEKAESGLVIIGLILISLAIYYFDKNRRILK